jgi:hypothetical protein
MDVIVNATPFRPEMFGEVVDMPTPQVMIVKTSQGYFTIHADEVREYFVK